MSLLASDPEARLARAHTALLGLAVGDALGGFFEFSRGAVGRRIRERQVPVGPWHWTDDTQMALSLFAVLRACGAVDQERFAASLAVRYERGRGYGMAMRAVVRRLREGEPWRVAAAGLFRGQGSFGNGCASRVVPVGAYFADDPALACLQAARSAEVTHAHPEALAGARAVAGAAAWACRPGAAGDGVALLDAALAQTPPGLVRDGLLRARALPPDAPVQQAAALLGNGQDATVQASVPFALWCAAARIACYEEAVWLTLEGQGDCDSTCAIVGALAALAGGPEAIPQLWRQRCEPLPAWAWQALPDFPTPQE